jgi:hypothetical protein
MAALSVNGNDTIAARLQEFCHPQKSANFLA